MSAPFKFTAVQATPAYLVVGHYARPDIVEPVAHRKAEPAVTIAVNLESRR